MSQNINSLIKLVQSNHKKEVKKFNIDELVKILRKLSDAYYNTGVSLVPDEIYDYIREELEKKDPENPFLFEVGAPIKGTKEKIRLPFEMGSLAKIKPDSEDLSRWVKKYKGSYVLSDKMDGASAQIYKDQTGKTHFYSRGDGIEGQDISHLLNIIFTKDQIKNLPIGTSVRGELIISKNNFKKVSSYMKNARNAVSGLVNSKTVDMKLAKITDFIAYAILNPRYKQYKQLELLDEWGFDIVEYKVVKKISNDMLSSYLEERRKACDYEMDGIVCVDDSKIYVHEGGYPDHAFAFKMILEDQIAETKVVKVEWNLSKDGYLKPRIKIEPVDLLGTTITYATAHNAKYIVDNKIGPGAKIKIIRSGDVIPYILEVTKQASEPQMPNEPYKWNNTNVDLIIKTIEGTGKRIITIKLITHFFEKLGVKYMSNGIVTKLVDNDYDSIIKILNADRTILSEIDGLGEASVTKIYTEIDRAFEECDLAMFMDASHKFERGFAYKKLNEIVKRYPTILTEKWDEDEMLDKILDVEGFSDKTAELFVSHFDEFKKFYHKIAKIKDISRFENIQENNSEESENEKLFVGKSIVFTGFRDKDLEKFIVNNGGKVSTSVSGNTYILIHADNADKSSSKFAKATKSGTKIMSKSEFIKKYK